MFEFLADLENDPKWRRERADAKHHSEGHVGLGTTSSLFGEMLGRRTEAVYEVVGYEPHRAETWKTVKGSLPLTFWRTVEGAGDGARVTMGYSGDFRGILRLLSPLRERAGKRALRGDLPTLKQLLESSST